MTQNNQKTIIPLSEPEISGNEWKYVKECLDTGWVSSAGSYVARFEEVVAKFIGPNKYACATINGTSAIHASFLTCGVQPGDEVIAPALTFIAPVNAARYCGADPVFMDSDPDTLCMDAQKISDFLKNECEHKSNGYKYNKKTGKRISAIIPVHIFGHPVDFDPILESLGESNISLIEDATESLGSEYKGKKTSGFGKVGCLSFNANKLITSGGGGMMVSADKSLIEKARHLCNQAKKDSFNYFHDEIGYNYRISNIQAAIGVAQMERIDEFISVKRKNAEIFKQLISEIDEAELLWEKPYSKSNFWFFTLRVAKAHKNKLLEYLVKKNIQVRPLWRPINTLPMYKKFQNYHVESAIKSYDTCINLPCSVSLKEDDIHYVCENIKSFFFNNLPGKK